LIRQALVTKVFPGAVLMVSQKGVIQFQQAYGVANIFDGRPVTIDTVFDLASLTKPLATSLAVMQLIASQQLSLNQSVGSILAPFNSQGKKTIAIEHLLSHTSGYPDYRPYYLHLANFAQPHRRPELRKLLAAEPLQSLPGAEVCYSDLGFMVLQWVVETVTNQRLDAFVTQSIYQPLGLDRLFFIDLDKPRPDVHYAATEVCPWRGALLEGAVHDENAYALGGISGQAGLFGDAPTVHKLLAELARAYSGSSPRDQFATETVGRFFKRYEGHSMALGFDVPAASASSSGQYFSRNSVGHLGFTGTSFWVDLDRSAIVILLTNRVHPSRANDKLKAFRPLLHDAVMQAL
jgi:CubicO group peptidase (beta-lactamase class C family)